MAVDYDLVVLGGTQAGQEAARYAAQLGARVALVMQGLEGRRSPLQTLGTIWTTRASNLGYQSPEITESSWQWAIQRATLIADTLTREDFQQLMVQGVDVVAEQGQLVGDRPLQVETPSRHLTTRALLLATGNVPRPPAISGLESVSYETPERVLQREILPQSVIVLGCSPTALMLCQILRRWERPVTLVTSKSSLLSQEDPDVSRWIMAQLRAEGVQLWLKTPVKTINAGPADPPHQSGVALHLADETITATALIVAAAGPSTAGMNLAHFIDDCSFLGVNGYLQTSHPRIYACGSVLGGYEMSAIARQEARIAVTNALFWNRQTIDYCNLPYDLLTQPEMARVGLTEPQARRRYGQEDLLVSRQPLYENPKAQWLESTIGFCKIVAHRSGPILGVHGVGPEANEWVQTLAGLMIQKTPWQTIANQGTIPHSLHEVLRQTVQQWECDRWKPGQWRRDWAENWCNWRRSR